MQVGWVRWADNQVYFGPKYLLQFCFCRHPQRAVGFHWDQVAESTLAGHEFGALPYLRPGLAVSAKGVLPASWVRSALSTAALPLCEEARKTWQSCCDQSSDSRGPWWARQMDPVQSADPHPSCQVLKTATPLASGPSLALQWPRACLALVVCWQSWLISLDGSIKWQSKHSCLAGHRLLQDLSLFDVHC